ncbi:hypothetical protein [Pedobacter metabolipauper]|uniref:Uncharacterized protein n=1 Tax=Pedobacter metabolipauper TaxID=425513 RepID=A0A4V6PW26_9SPHI|nr:hypothetical protein [Pedobacter metabolipauper]TDQ11503.1 hypothetical protein ATK78_0626 [Pedobacter metabolipauper]
MKYSIIVALSDSIAPTDYKAWTDIGKKIQQPPTVLNAVLKDAAQEIARSFPDLPSSIVWGNYLVFDEHGDFFVIDIDFENVELIRDTVFHVAEKRGLTVLIGKENKIYRPGIPL